MEEISIKPFSLAIPEAQLQDLQQRLRQTRWPSRETVDDWSQGVPLQAMRDLCDYWLHSYDWRKCEAWLNSAGQYTAKIDDLTIHFLHIRSPEKDAMPLLLLHGWPGSVLEFRKVVDRLSDPARHGASSADAFHLVIPSLPGYGFSTAPTQSGFKLYEMAKVTSRLMDALGYKRWVAQGGDWGADICAVMASRDPPKSLMAVHMNTPFFDIRKEIRPDTQPSSAEELASKKQLLFESKEDGYFKLQATRPQTVGYALADSPVGQAAWIYEKLYMWTENRGKLEDILTYDDILDNIMLYWLSNSGASSARLYWEDKDSVDVPIDIPVGMSVFPGDLVYAPRAWGERYYSNIVHWNEAEKGGHFAAWEVPEIFIREVRECFSHVRRMLGSHS